MLWIKYVIIYNNKQKNYCKKWEQDEIFHLIYFLSYFTIIKFNEPKTK
jgi:hypothetical protein